MKKILLLFLLLCSSFIFAQYQFKVITKEGEEIRGELKSFVIRQNTNNIHMNTKSGELSFLSKDLTDIFLWTTDSTKSIQLSNINHKIFTAKNRSEISKKNNWIVKKLTSSKADLYITGVTISTKNGGFEIFSIGSGFSYFIKKKDDDFVALMGLSRNGVIGSAYYIFIKPMAEYYFNDCPSLAEKIKDKKILKKMTYTELFEIYSNCE